ncbi:hypothetical protein MXB_3396, partial [Myxobolus squamalis]
SRGSLLSSIAIFTYNREELYWKKYLTQGITYSFPLSQLSNQFKLHYKPIKYELFRVERGNRLILTVSGGVVIYFDRIEVVNILRRDAGILNKIESKCIMSLKITRSSMIGL